MTTRKTPEPATTLGPVVVAAAGPASPGQEPVPASPRLIPPDPAGLAGSSPGAPIPQGDNGAPGPTPRVWRVELPAGLKVLTLNDRLHWAENYRRGQSLKKAAWVMALKAKIPHLQKGTVHLEYQPPDLRERDGDNLAPVAKHCIDGLVAAKVFSNDSSKYVFYSGCTISESLWPKGRITIVITEVAQ